MFELEMIRTFRQNVDPRRRKELRDSRTLQEDRQAIANLSPVAIHREWQKDEYGQYDNGID